MTQEELIRLKAEIAAAEADNTPFLVASSDDVAIAGDPNKTEKKKYDYEMTFVLSKRVGDDVQFFYHTVEYKDIYVTPRQNPRIVALLTKLMPYFKKTFPDGTIGEYTNEEAYMLIAEWEDDILDLMYKLVGSVLGIDKSLWDNMVIGSVIEAFIQIVHNIPNVVNEADVSFQGSGSPFIK